MKVNKHFHLHCYKEYLSERERQISLWYHLYVESKIRHNWTYLWNRNRLTDTENRLVVAKDCGEGWIGSLGLADANYYT